MPLETVFTARGQDWTLHGLPLPLSLDRLLPGGGDWEVEIGFGKGRYLLRRATERPEVRFLGLELVSKYYRLLRGRARRHAAANLLLARGEALYLLSAVLPSAFASKLHVYFPDPWPKSRHHKRRLFDPETLDLVLGVLRPGGELYFATDFIDYGRRVREILDGYPGLVVESRAALWSEGARTNYEAKYVAQGRPILRLKATLAGVCDGGPTGPCAGSGGAALHPEGRAGVLAATAPRG